MPPAPSSAPLPAGVMTLGRIGGVPFVASRNWPLFLVIMAGLSVSALMGSGLSPVEIVFWAFGMTVILVVAILAHEGSHALVGSALGLEVTHVQLTMWGGYTGFVAWRQDPWRKALVALAGPLANLLLAGFAWIGISHSPHLVSLAMNAAYWTNLSLALFNLLPGAPMDGGQVAEALVWRLTGSRGRGLQVAGILGLVAAMGLVAWGLSPALAGAAPRWWTVFIALLLAPSAAASLRQAGGRDALDAITVAQASMPATLVAAEVTLGEAQRHAGAGRIPVLWADGKVVGIVPPGQPTPEQTVQPATHFALSARPQPVLLEASSPLIDVAGSMQRLGIEIIVVRHPDGEPRVVTGATAMAALGAGLPTATPRRAAES